MSLRSLPLPDADHALRHAAERAFYRAAGAPLVGGNAVDLLIDGQAHFDAWLAAIRGAQRRVLLENYIFRDDAVGRAFLDALTERAAAGVEVRVLRDWLGCFGESSLRFWKPLLAAGGEVRTYNRPGLPGSGSWLSRDHRKSLVVDATIGFVSGVCVSGKWLGRPDRDVPPWRDTGVALRGPVLGELTRAFAAMWAATGEPLPQTEPAAAIEAAGSIDVRLIATRPSTTGVYRLDQLVAALAQRSLWLADAYFVGVAPYVQALAAAARDGVDVRLLVPGSSDVGMVASLSRAGYRPLLEAGVRVFEWNGSMMHAKTAVADGRWARVGSSNLNIASWLGNCEIDVAIEDAGFAERMERQYEVDLCNATEIVLTPRRRVRRTEPSARHRPRGGRGSSSRATASAMRFVNTVGAAFSRHRVLGPAEAGVALVATFSLVAFAALAILRPHYVAWPLAGVAAWMATAMLMRHGRHWWRRAVPSARNAEAVEQADEDAGRR